MKILYPEFIFLMLIPSFLLLYLVVTNKSFLERVFDENVLKKIKIDRGLDKKTKIVFLFLALFLMILALSRPVIEKGEVEVEVKNFVVIALDISKSMLADDVYPNRLKFAKKKIETFIKESKNLDISLIAFSKESFLVSPLSSDKETLLFLLNHLDTMSIDMQGTNFLSALNLANRLLRDEKNKTVIFFTDGGDKRDFSKEIEFANKNALKVFIVAIGTKKGSLIPTQKGFLKDKNQNLVVTRVNENIKDLALKTGGEFIQATPGKEDIKKILKKLQSGKKNVEKNKIILTLELYTYILFVAFIFLFFTFFSLSSKKGIFFILFLIGSLNLKAGILDFQDIKKAKELYKRGNYEAALQYFKKIADSKKSSQAFYDLANAYYKIKRYKEAIKYYNLVETPNKKLKFYTLYNLGNSYFMLKNYKKAVEFYKKALALEDDKDCRYNLELALKMLRKNQKFLNNKSKNIVSSQKSLGKGFMESKKSGQRSRKRANFIREKKIKNTKKETISNKEAKKWLEIIKETPQKSLMIPNRIKQQGDFSENPW